MLCTVNAIRYGTPLREGGSLPAVVEADDDGPYVVKPGALDFDPAVGPAPDPALAADVVWFDALVMNVDRTPLYPGLVLWHRRPWLIDHGAALYAHHTWRDPERHARGAFPMIRDHILLHFAGSLAEADERPVATRPFVEEAERARAAA